MVDSCRLLDSLGLLLGLLNFGELLIVALVCDGGLAWLGRLVAGLADGAAHGGVLDSTGGRGAGGVGALGLAADEHCLGLRELDVYVVLHHTGKLAVEFIGFASLADVELGLPGRHRAAGATAVVVASLVVVGFEVIEKAEERGEGGVVGVVNVAREEGHCVGVGRCKFEGDGRLNVVGKACG